MEQRRTMLMKRLLLLNALVLCSLMLTFTSTSLSTSSPAVIDEQSFLDSPLQAGTTGTTTLSTRSVVDGQKPSNDSLSRRRNKVVEAHQQRPKAVIYYLAQSNRTEMLQRSITSLDINFNNAYRYPIVVFYEDTDTAFNVSAVRACTSSFVIFQKIHFAVPSFLNASSVPQLLFDRYTLGYRHMCRFHAYGVYEEPVMADVDYALRLDDDSVFLRPIRYDLFVYMSRHRLQYGYVLLMKEGPDFISGLWEAVDEYVRMQTNGVVASTFYYDWPRTRIYLNNFELSSTKLWNSDTYRKLFDYVDRLGGIYYGRWGDAPIKTIAVSLLLKNEEIHRFKDVAYQHKKAKNIPSIGG